MAATMLLDRATWDLLLDANGNMALAQEPYALAQDAASAIQTFGPTATEPGECYWDTTVGMPWGDIFGKAVPLALLKAQLVENALTVPGTTGAQAFITAFLGRNIQGQVKVTPATGTDTAVATFDVSPPQGSG